MIKKPRITINKKKILLIIGVVGLIGASAGVAYWQTHKEEPNTWETLGTNVTNTKNMFYESDNYAETDKITYEFYEKETCKDCQKLKKYKVVQKLHQLKKDNNIIVYNTKRLNSKNDQDTTENQAWFNQSFVYQTPSVVVKYKGHPIFTYSGTNIKTWTLIAQEINPVTKKQFSKKIPKTQLVVNDFTKTKTMYASQPIKSINNQTY